MSFPLSPQAATQAVIWGGLIIGLLLGAAGQASRFCVRGAVADLFSFGSTTRLMTWILAVAVAATGTMALISAGWLDATRTIAWGDRLLWVSCLVGGSLFGIGMVLAQGCPQRSLVKAGSGNLKAIVTLIVAAIAAQMTLRGVLAEPRVRFLDASAVSLGHPQDLGSLLAPLTALTPGVLRWAILAVLLIVAAVLLWQSRAGMGRVHWIGGVAVGMLVPAAWLLTGSIGYLPEHPDTLEATWLGTYSHRPEALSFAAPIAHSLDLLTLWSDRNNTASFGVMLSLGVLLGSAVSALLRKEFLVESFSSAAELRGHLLGGTLMGFGGVTALGCSIGQGVSGLSLLSAGAMLATAGMVAGAWITLLMQARQLEPGLSTSGRPLAGAQRPL